MRNHFVVASVVSVVLVACGHDEGAPATAPTATASSPVTSVPAASASASPSASASAPAATGKALPPVDAKCTADADCATVQVNLDGDLQCCNGCGTSTAGNKAWAAKVNELCAAPPHKSCPALACVGGLLKAECKAGTCTLKK